jgi:hypothetical protein
MVVLTCNSSTQEVKAGRLLSSRPTWAIYIAKPFLKKQNKRKKERKKTKDGV